MAINLIAEPQEFTTAYNPIKYIYDSTNNTEDGFKYIFDIYDSVSATKIAEYRLLPNLDGYGELDLSRLLQNYVSYDFDSSNDSFFNASNGILRYEVNVGEEYIQDVSYTASLTQNGTYTTITATHSFQVGDQVTIVEDTVTNPSINGLFTVTSINTTVDFTVNSLWSEITDPTEDGTVSYADKRKTVTRDIALSGNKYVINGALPFASFPTWDYLEYYITTGVQSDKLFLTTPTDFTMTPSQDMWINMNKATGVTGCRMYFENSNGDILYKAVGNFLLQQVSVGTNNAGTLTVDTGSLPLVKDDTEWYDFYLATATEVKSATYRINIDRRCKINDYEIVFLDRMGSIGSFAFQLKDKLTGKLIKDVMNQNIEGAVTSSEWSYTTEAQGNKNINNRIEETYTLNTNWMDENDNDYFTQLVTSPQTWIKINDEYFSCIVQDRSYEKQRQRNKNLIRKTIQVKLSVQDRING